MKRDHEFEIFLKTLLKIAWHFIPKFTKIAALIIFIEMTIIIMMVDPQERFGLIAGFMFMLPFILFVFFMSTIEPNKKIKEKL